MIDLRPLHNLFIVMLVLLPFGAWKFVEVVIWLLSHITIK